MRGTLTIGAESCQMNFFHRAESQLTTPTPQSANWSILRKRSGERGIVVVVVVSVATIHSLRRDLPAAEHDDRAVYARTLVEHSNRQHADRTTLSV